MNATNAMADPVRFDAPRRIAPEDQARADYYGLLAHLFYQAPDDRLLAALVVASPPEGDGAGELKAAWEALAAASAIVDHEAVAEEFATAFIGMGRPPVMLFGSYYLAGFMNEKPLAELRSDLAALGFARAEGATESEDHLAAVCEVMRSLIQGDLARSPAGIDAERDFFMKHVQPWAGACCAAITASDKANYYRKVAAFARAFFRIEEEAFRM